MAHKAVKVLGMVAVVAGIGAAASWYVLSGKVMHFFESGGSVTAANSQAGSPNYKMTWTSIERLPFPTIGARLKDPKIELTVPGQAGTAPVSIVVDSKMTFDIESDYVGAQYRITTHLGSEGSLQIGSEKTVFAVQGGGGEASIKARSVSDFITWNSLNAEDKEAVKTALKSVESFHWTTPPMTMTNATTKALIMSTGPTEASFTNRSNDNVTDFDLRMDIKESEITPEYTAIVKKILPEEAMATASLSEMPFSYERAGKQDMTLDVGLKIPSGQTPGLSMGEGMIDVRKAYMKNNFYTINVPLRIEKKSGEGAAIIAKLDWSIEATPAAAAEVSRLFDMGSGYTGMLDVRMKHANPGTPTSSMLPQVKEKVIAALPTLSTLGPVTLALDVETSGAASGASAKSLTLRNLALNHKRWGLEAKGTATQDNTSGAKVDATINCVKCDYMTWDATTAAIQAQDAANTMQPGSTDWGVTADTMTKVNTLLAQLGKKDPTTGNIGIEITTPAPNDIRIGGRPMAEAMMLAMALFAPAAAAQEPAAGRAAPPAKAKAAH